MRWGGGTVVTKDGLQYVSYGGDDYYLTTNGKSDGSPLSDSASGYNLTVNIQPGSTGTLKIYGGRNLPYNRD